MDRPDPNAYPTFDDYDDETATQLTSRASQPQRKQTLRMGLPPLVPPPTSVTLPARGAGHSVALPLEVDDEELLEEEEHEALEGLASLPIEELDLEIDNSAPDSTQSELSVVFRGAHQSERPPMPPSLRLVPAPSVGRSGHPPPPPSSLAMGDDGEVRSESARLPPPPRVPGELPPAPRADDFDDDVDTIVLPSRMVHLQDSLHPVEVRSSIETRRAFGAGAKPPRRPPWLALALAGVLGAGAVAAAAVFIVDEEQGDLVVDVADQQCGAVQDVKVFVDEKLVCTTSPCALRVSKGGHVVQAEATGYERTGPEAVMVDPAMPTLHRVQFGSSSKTGIEVRSELKGYSLYLDGKLVGELPQRVSGLSSGEHTLLISGGEDYYAEERKVTLQADEMMVLDDVKLRPKAGTLVIGDNPELAQALVSLDGEQIQLPFEREIDASRRYHVVAKRPGYEEFETYVDFEGKSRRKELDIQLVPKAASSESTNESTKDKRPSSLPSEAERGKQESSGERSPVASTAKASGKASLTLQSTPPSNVLLDGRPIGQTPKSVSVDPGTHAILFVHPTKGKARASAKLAPGQSKTLRARF